MTLPRGRSRRLVATPSATSRSTTLVDPGGGEAISIAVVSFVWRIAIVLPQPVRSSWIRRSITAPTSLDGCEDDREAPDIRRVLAQGTRMFGARLGACPQPTEGGRRGQPPPFRAYARSEPYSATPAGSLTSGTSTTAEWPSTSTFGSHCSHVGRYQLRSPSSFIADGTRTDRTIVASKKTAIARPKPISCSAAIRPLANAPNPATMMTAPPVMIPPVVRRPYATASALSLVLSYSSRIRLSRNTW